MKLFKDLPNTDTPINAESLNQIQDNLVIVSSTEPTGDDREKLWIKRGKNRFNKNNAIPGWVTGGGYTGASEVTKRTGKMKVKGNTSYVFSFDYETLAAESDREYCVYDTNNNVLTTIGNTYSRTDKYFIVKPTQDGYIDIAYDINCTNIMFEQNTQKTPYEEYIEPKIYLKNNNNVYEELKDALDYTENFQNLVNFEETIANCNFLKKDNVVEVAYQGENKTHTANQLIFTLPEGYRPLKDTYIPFVKNILAFGVILIMTDGKCYVNQISDATASGRLYFNCTFII